MMITDKIQNTWNGISNAIIEYLMEWKKSIHEVREECVPDSNITLSEIFRKVADTAKYMANNWLHIPYLPSFHRPGWLLHVLMGPFNTEWLYNLHCDFWAGLTMACLYIPQGLSYGTLANLPPVIGLYSAIFPSAAYATFGTSMVMSVGPGASTSLLVGQVILQTIPNPTVNLNGALDVAAQVAFGVSTILLVMSVFNCGSLIAYISHPVMSGFTTGIAMNIGLTQLKSAFGFTCSVPQMGQVNYDYNYSVMQWFIQNWNGQYPASNTNPLLNNEYYRNSIATQICFGTYAFLFVLGTKLKDSIKATPERKNKVWFIVWQAFANISPLLAIILGARAAYILNQSPAADTYEVSTLKLVGSVTPGLNILRIPNTSLSAATAASASSLVGPVIGITLVICMESYSIGRRLAVARNELYLHNASQEMFALGLANLLTTISSSIPATGTVSRSSVANAAGNRTQLTHLIAMVIILLALSTLTSSFYYIPQASLAAVIFAAIGRMITIEDFWQAWKHSKKDFITMLASAVFTLFFNSELGLAVGFGVAGLLYLVDVVMLTNAAPYVYQEAVSNDGIDVVSIGSDITFLTVPSIRKLISSLMAVAPTPVYNNQDESRKSSLSTSVVHRMNRFSDRLTQRVSSRLDSALYSYWHKEVFIDILPRAIVLDLLHVRVIDLSGLKSLAELMGEGRSKNIRFVVINVRQELMEQLTHFGLYSDVSDEVVNLDKYLDMETNHGTKHRPSRALTTSSSLGVVSTFGFQPQESDVDWESSFSEVNAFRGTLTSMTRHNELMKRSSFAGATGGYNGNGRLSSINNVGVRSSSWRLNSISISSSKVDSPFGNSTGTDMGSGVELGAIGGISSSLSDSAVPAAATIDSDSSTDSVLRVDNNSKSEIVQVSAHTSNI